MCTVSLPSLNGFICTSALTEYNCIFKTLLVICGGALGVMVIVVGNGHGDTSSNAGRDSLHFIALIPLGKVGIQLFSLQLWVNSRAD